MKRFGICRQLRVVSDMDVVIVHLTNTAAGYDLARDRPG